MPKYLAYGLTLQANQRLPGLVPAADPAAVDISADLMDSLHSQRPSPQVEAVAAGMEWRPQSQGSALHIWFRGDGQLDFHLDPQGTQIKATWDRSVLEEVTGLLVGPVLASALRLRGILCLHACVIAIGSVAIAIVGESGAGKSTTAAALAARGYPVVADDVAALEPSSAIWRVHAGYPRLRLWPETIRQLYGPETHLSRIFSFSEKRFIELQPVDPTAVQSVPWQFQAGSLPLAAIYILGQRQPDLLAPIITAVPPSAAVILLMGHRSVGHLMPVTPEQQTREFMGLSQVAAAVPVRRVTPCDAWEALPQLCDAIVDDVTAIALPQPCLQP